MVKVFKDKVFLSNLFIISIPIIFQEMLNSSINLIDTLMIGQLGEVPVAAVGLANQIFFLLNLILFGITSGAGIFIGQYYGRGDIKSIHKVMGISYILGILASFIFFVSAFFIPGTIMGFYSNDIAVIKSGVEYLKIIAFSYPLTALIMCTNIVLKATKKTKQPMITTLVSLLVNVSLNYLFIFVLKLGVIGASLATLSARTCEFLLQIILMFINKSELLTNIKNYFRIEKEFLKSYSKIVAPVILNEFFWAFGTTMYNVAYKFSGTEAQVAVQISNTFQQLFLVVMVGLGTGTAIILSNCLGSGDINRAIDYSKKSIFISFIFSLMVSVTIFILSYFVTDLFDVTESVKLLAKYNLWVVAIGSILKTINYTSIIGILRSGGDTKFTLILDASTVWSIGIPMAFLGSYFLGLPIYVTYAMVYLEELVKIFISLNRVKSNKWANKII